MKLHNLKIESNPIKFVPHHIRPQMAKDCNAVSAAIAHALNVEMVTGLHDHDTPGEFLTHVFKKVETIASALRYLFCSDTEGEKVQFHEWTVSVYKGTVESSVEVELNDSHNTSAIIIKLSGIDFLNG